MKIPFQTAYAPWSFPGITFPDDGLTKQAFKDECDINNVMRRFEKDGVLEHVNKFQGDYGDFAAVQDYHTSLNEVLDASEAFNSLPAKMRKKFNNDPGEFLEFVTDDRNRDEMREMGLLSASATEPPEDAPGGPAVSPAPQPTPPEPPATEGEPQA